MIIDVFVGGCSYLSEHERSWQKQGAQVSDFSKDFYVCRDMSEYTIGEQTFVTKDNFFTFQPPTANAFMMESCLTRKGWKHPQ